jgi:septum site-determining protein MinC
MSESTVPLSSADVSSAPALRTPARPAAEFKGLSHPALRLVLNDADDAAIAAALEDLVGDGEAFEWQPVVLDAARISTAERLDLEALCARLGAGRLHPVAIAGAHAALREDAERLRLGWLAALPERRARPAAEAAPTGAPQADAPQAGQAPSVEPGAAPDPTRAAADAAHAEPASGQTSAQAASDEAGPDASAGPSAVPPPTVPPGAMVVERPVRSGQQIYARERDLVVVGDVSPGAEVIADGHVHVYGTLGGRAIAGARGRRDAAIFALELRAELVAVCGIYRTFEDGPPAANAGKPVRISLEADADTLSIRSL